MSPWRERATALAAFATMALLFVGVASPHVKRVAPVENATVVLVVDTSRSMLATDVAPTRLGAAKAAARTFLDRVEKKIRVGLVTFSGDVTVAASPTHDRELLRQSVAAIDPFMGGRGTAIGDALARAVELSRQSFAEPGTPPSTAGPIPGAEGAVSILFLSDGRQNRGILLPEAGAALAAEAKIPVYTVALGTDNPDEGPWPLRRLQPFTRPRDAARDRTDDRGRVLRGALRACSCLRLRRPRLAPWTREAAYGRDVLVRRRRGRLAGGCRRARSPVGAVTPLTAS